MCASAWRRGTPTPRSAERPTIVLIHGGFWRDRYDRSLMEPLADDLSMSGWTVENIEYPRLGSGGGWPATFDAVHATVEPFAARGAVTIGHSAGGQLALWLAAELPLAGAVSQAGVTDLRRADALGVGGGVIRQLLGGGPQEVPERYNAASPVERLPIGVSQLLVHGDRDGDVPVEQSRSYVEAARATGDEVEYVELPGTGHYEHLDPRSAAWGSVIAWLDDRWPRHGVA